MPRGIEFRESGTEPQPGRERSQRRSRDVDLGLARAAAGAEAGAELRLATHLRRAHSRQRLAPRARGAFDQTAVAPLPESNAATVQPAQADLELQFLEAPTVAQESIPTLVGVRVRNLGPPSPPA